VSKHRILHLFVTLPVGGAENLLLSILRKLDPQRFSSLVCCIGERGALGNQVMATGFPLTELHLLSKGGMDRRVVPALVDLIRRERIDLVHSHLYHANFYGRLAAGKAGVPAVASIHNTYTKHKWHRQLANWYLARSTASIIAGSEEIKQDVVRYDHVPEALVEVIPNSVDLARSHSALSREQARERLGVPEGAIVLGTVGRLEEQKGHRYLIEALSQLRQRGMDAYLLLVGGGREELALRELSASLKLEQRVMFLGTRSDLGDLFRAMDMFVMPSLWEGLSLAMLSAMAAGLPVVATAVGGVQQVLANDEYGFSVLPGDAAALASRIEACFANPEEMVRMGEKGQRRVCENYSDEAMVRRLEAVYARVLKK
jgi:glycosyltransferase involved in cell wall biosynthesis